MHVYKVSRQCPGSGVTVKRKYIWMVLFMPLLASCSDDSIGSGKTQPYQPDFQYLQESTAGKLKRNEGWKQVVLDSKSNLMWWRCVDGQEVVDGRCVGVPDQDTRRNVERIADSVGSFGVMGWRLPTTKELVDLMECKHGKNTFDPNNIKTMKVCKGWEYDLSAISFHAFPDTPKGWFMTSGWKDEGMKTHWVVNFYTSQVKSVVDMPWPWELSIKEKRSGFWPDEYETEQYYVRWVRDIQPDEPYFMNDRE